MKKYKVGDTVYVKGKVKAIDNTALPYCVDFGNGNNFIDFESGTVWVTSDNMIDELPTAEPVKPVLPKKVADELEIAKECKDSFDVYIMRIINGHTTYENSHVFWSNSGDGVIKTLMDAWDNGYTVAKEKKYLVYKALGGKHTADVQYAQAYLTSVHSKILWILTSWILTNEDTDESFFQFTEAEIEHYGLQDCEREEVK